MDRLYETAFPQKFKFLEKTREPNGLGGFEEVYKEGAEFSGSLVRDTSATIRVAEKEGFTSVYTLTVSPDIPLQEGDLFKSVETGDSFKITSRPKEKQTPAMASFQFQNFSAELYSL